MADVYELDAKTGIVIERAYTSEEIAQREKDKKTAKEEAQANADRAKLKAETLAKLGLTADEVAALLS